MPAWFAALLGWFGIAEFIAPTPDLAFAIDPEDPMSITVTATPGTPTNNVPVAHLAATVAIVGSPSFVLDLTAGPATFAANVGDKGDVTLVAYSAAGIASAPTVVPFDLTRPDAVPLTLGFAQAPDPAPTPAPTPAAS